MSNVQPPGLIELPGMKGTIGIHFDLTRGDVTLDVAGLPLPTVVQILLMATQGTVAQWAQIDAGIIRPKGELHGGEEKSSTKETNDDDDGRGNSDGGGSGG